MASASRDGLQPIPRCGSHPETAARPSAGPSCWPRWRRRSPRLRR
ncbi:hypothetical protein ACFPRL_19730 [Pseudoclavibacter helvolus]